MSDSQQPPVVYVQMVAPTPTNALAVASLVLGIITAVLGLIPIVGWFFLPVPGILAFIFGIIGISTARKLNGKRYGLALAGLLLSLSPIIVIFISLIVSGFTQSR